MKETKEYIMFWGKEDIYSNFYPITFKHRGRIFNNSEQAFMWRKAQYFKDWQIAGEILNAKNPNHAKSLGRKVRNFNEEQWNKIRYDIMVEVVKDKFMTTHLKREILDTDLRKDFVEASPYDKIWGVGLKANDPKILDESNWKGQNLLGKVMEDVRVHCVYNKYK
ncbi:hypothetical protein VL14_ORF200 [Staphylococcus phage vB_SauM_VL14]|nr:hypothetical protein VL14_ORF200 [Staphylococcus phage vB_SauM_VL14]